MKKQLLQFFTIFLLVLSPLNGTAQKYKPASFFDIAESNTVRKVDFSLAGEKLLLTKITTDTANHEQTLHVTLLNPNYTVFKYMSKTVSELQMINIHEGGVVVVENIESNGPVYYFLYNSNQGTDVTTSNKATIVREDGTVTGFGYCSWMGFQVVNIDGLHKLIADAQAVDTIYYDNETGKGWYTYQFGTSAVYDVKTGALEHAFERGTTVTSVEKVNGSFKYFTTNDYFMRSQDPNDPWGMVYNFGVNHYNADFSTWIYSIMNFSILPIEGYSIYNASMYNPVVAGPNLYFIHQVVYMDDFNQSISKSYLTDKDGNVISTADKWVFNKFHFGMNQTASVKYLPTLGNYGIIDYSTVYSIPTLDSIGSFNSFLEDTLGGIKFINFDYPTIKVSNDDFSPYKTIQVSDSLMYMSGASQYEYNDDSKLEFIFKQDSSLVVYNEAGDILVNQGIKALGGSPFGSGLPIVLQADGEKYGRISDVDGYQNIRTMPLTVNLKNDISSGKTVQLYRQNDGDVNLFSDTLSQNGSAIFDVQEGVYFARLLNASTAMSTYHTNALLWSEATPILFTTGVDTTIEIDPIQVPAALNNDDQGSISGTVKHTGVRTQDVHPIEVYVRSITTNAIVAQQKLVDSTYSVSNLPLGIYAILVNEPGFNLESYATITLLAENPRVENVNFVASNTLHTINSTFTSAVRTVETKRGLAPNPARDFVSVPNADVNASVQILDLTGKTILNTRLKNQRFDVSNLKSGVYFVRWISAGLPIMDKLIKE